VLTTVPLEGIINTKLRRQLAASYVTRKFVTMFSTQQPATGLCIHTPNYSASSTFT